MSLKFFAFLSLAILVSFTVALPYHKANFATTLGKSGYFKAEPKEEKRAPCANTRDDYYCFLESVYENACDTSPAEMKQKCSLTCDFC